METSLRVEWATLSKSLLTYLPMYSSGRGLSNRYREVSHSSVPCVHPKVDPRKLTE